MEGLPKKKKGGKGNTRGARRQYLDTSGNGLGGSLLKITKNTFSHPAGFGNRYAQKEKEGSKNFRARQGPFFLHEAHGLRKTREKGGGKKNLFRRHTRWGEKLAPAQKGRYSFQGEGLRKREKESERKLKKNPESRPSGKNYLKGGDLTNSLKKVIIKRLKSGCRLAA